MKLAFQSCVLTLINIISILGGFCAYKLLRLGNQVLFQSVLAIVLNVLIFIVWDYLNKRYLHRLNINLLNIRSLIFASSIGLLWSPVIFIPVHYITQGYVTSFGNILALWLYQIAACAILAAGISITAVSKTTRPIN